MIEIGEVKLEVGDGVPIFSFCHLRMDLWLIGVVREQLSQSSKAESLPSVEVSTSDLAADFDSEKLENVLLETIILRLNESIYQSAIYNPF